MLIRRVGAGVGAVFALTLACSSGTARADDATPASDGSTKAVPLVPRPTPDPSARPAPPPVPSPAPNAARAGPMDVFSTRGGALPASVAYLQGQGVKMTSLGEQGGARSYLGEAANGRYQVFYVPPNGEYMAVGLMFRSGGENVTNGQVERMLRRFAEAAKSVQGVDVSGLKEPPPEAPSTVEPSSLPIVDWFRSQGLAVTPFGAREGGLDGYLVETPRTGTNERGVMQPFYVMPDPHYAVAGILAQRGGTNVTGVQIGEMRLKERAQGVVDAGPRSSAVAPGPVPPRAPEATVEQILKDDARTQGPVAGFSGPEAKSLATTAGTPVPVAVPAPTLPGGPISDEPPDAAAPFVSALPKAPFVEALKTSVWFSLAGPKATDAPILYMVADPQCPFCHATWRRLKPLVYAQKIQLRVIMIAGLMGSYPKAVSILTRQAGPAATWLAGEGSEDGREIKDGPLPGSGDWIRASHMLDVNARLIERFGVNRTPLLAYESPNGNLYATVGLPADLDAFLAAMR